MPPVPGTRRGSSEILASLGRMLGTSPGKAARPRRPEPIAFRANPKGKTKTNDGLRIPGKRTQQNPQSHRITPLRLALFPRGIRAWIGRVPPGCRLCGTRAAGVLDTGLEARGEMSNSVHRAVEAALADRAGGRWRGRGAVLDGRCGIHWRQSSGASVSAGCGPLDRRRFFCTPPAYAGS